MVGIRNPSKSLFNLIELKEIIMKKIKMKKRFGLIGTLMVAIFALTGIAHADGHLMFPIGKGCSWDSYHAFAKAHDYSGQKLTVTTRQTGGVADQFEKVLAYFAEATGAKVNHRGTQTFKQDVAANAEAGTSANITAFALPGFAADLAKRGLVTPLCSNLIDCEYLDSMHENIASPKAFIEKATWEGPDGKDHFYGVPYFHYVKSQLWYSPEDFEAAGYKIPQTWEELKALEQQIIADGTTPWCVGLFAEGSTGWPAQDMLEEVLLRTYPVEVYDKWITNEIKMDDPRIVAALEELGKILRDEKMAFGGPKFVASGDWRVAANTIFKNPPDCYLFHQGSYTPPAAFEKKYQGESSYKRDWDFFYIPTRANRPDLAKNPVNMGGHFMTITKDSPAARGFIEFIMTPIAHELWMAQGGFLTPHKYANQALNPPSVAKLNGFFLKADPVRFDGSDLMPGAVGGTALNRGMIDYTGGKSAKDVLKGIQEVWDNLK